MTRPYIGRAKSPRDIARVLREKWRVFRFYAGDQPLAGPLFRWGIWAIRCLLRLPAIVEIPRYEMRLALLPRWKGCWKPIYVFRERFFDVTDPELTYVQRRLRPGDVFIDAGGYHGWYTLLASRSVGEGGRVVAFEPNPASFETLTQNLALNGCGNVRALDVALAGVDGSVSLFTGPDDGVASSLGKVQGWEREVRVPARRLDAILKEMDIQHVTLLKIDVEGAELDLLNGAPATLATSRPAVIFEVNPAAARNTGVPEHAAWDLLEGMGYRFFTVSGTALAPLMRFTAPRQGTVLNVVAIHGEPRDEGSFARHRMGEEGCL